MRNCFQHLCASPGNRALFALRGLRRAGWLCGALAVLPAALANGTSKEYQIKAAFLYNFTKFVEWPSDHFAAPGTPITIGILGPNPFGQDLEDAVRGRSVNGRSIRVVKIKGKEDVGKADLLFVAGSEQELFAGVCEVASRLGVVTVGESPQFAEAQGMFTFYLEGDKIRFSVNVAAAEWAGLKLSSRLLSVAGEVHGKRE